MRLSETQTGRREVVGRGTASAMSVEESSKSSMGFWAVSSPPVGGLGLCVRFFCVIGGVWLCVCGWLVLGPRDIHI